MTPTIVITGSTRGIGFGLADSFLKLGGNVVVTGRSQNTVNQALTKLEERYDRQRLLGQPCDVAEIAQVQAVWDAAQTRFGRVDIWINNAGLGNVMLPFWEQPPERLRAVVDTNLMGTLYCCQVAIQGMRQQGGGHIYNMEGFGSNGSLRNGLTPYGTTKYAIRYLTRALVKETQNTPVKVSSLSPGIVITDLLTDGYMGLDAKEIKNARRVFNILGDRVETVTPYLAQKVLENDRAGAHINWLTTPKVIRRFLLARFNQRDLFNQAE